MHAHTGTISLQADEQVSFVPVLPFDIPAELNLNLRSK